MTNPELDKTDGPDEVKETTTVPADTDTDTDTEKPAETPEESTDDAAESADEQATDDSSEDTADDAEGADEAAGDVTEDKSDEPASEPRRRVNWSRVVALAVLPALALLLAAAAGFLKWQDSTVRDGNIAGMEAVQVAKDSTVALLSYQPDTVEEQLGAARDLLTGDFQDSYTSLTNDVVIPGAKEQQISAEARVPASALVSAEPDHAVVLVFVNQTVVVGTDPPTDTASTVRVTLDKIDGRWLISEFEPV